MVRASLKFSLVLQLNIIGGNAFEQPIKFAYLKKITAHSVCHYFKKAKKITYRYWSVHTLLCGEGWMYQ